MQTIALPFASQPYGVAFAPTGGFAFVVLEALGRVLKLDASTGAQLGSVDVGPNPRHLAVSGDGATLLVSRFITPHLPGEETAVVQTQNGAVQYGGEVVRVSTGSMTVVGTTILQHSDKADVENQGSGVPNYLGAPVISPDGTSAWVPSKQDNVKRGMLRNGLDLNFQSTVRAISSRIDLSTNSRTTYRGSIDRQCKHRQRRCIRHTTASTSSLLSRRVGKWQWSMRTDTGKYSDSTSAVRLRDLLFPRTAEALRQQLHGAIRRSIRPLAPDQLSVRPTFRWSRLCRPSPQRNSALRCSRASSFFYDAQDPRLARDKYLSCASCHNDGGQDGRVWDLTGFGEGLRNTINLRGRAGAQGQGFLHWSGNFDEVQDFEGQIRNLSGGTGPHDQHRFQHWNA